MWIHKPVVFNHRLRSTCSSGIKSISVHSICTGLSSFEDESHCRKNKQNTDENTALKWPDHFFLFRRSAVNRTRKLWTDQSSIVSLIMGVTWMGIIMPEDKEDWFPTLCSAYIARILGLSCARQKPRATLGRDPSRCARFTNAGLMPAQRCRRWASIKTTLDQRPVFAWLILKQSSTSEYKQPALFQWWNDDPDGELRLEQQLFKVVCLWNPLIQDFLRGTEAILSEFVDLPAAPHTPKNHSIFHL